MTDYEQTVLSNDRYIVVEAFSGDNYDRECEDSKKYFLILLDDHFSIIGVGIFSQFENFFKNY